jgi:hypothetical protein
MADSLPELEKRRADLLGQISPFGEERWLVGLPIAPINERFLTGFDLSLDLVELRDCCLVHVPHELRASSQEAEEIHEANYTRINPPQLRQQRRPALPNPLC